VLEQIRSKKAELETWGETAKVGEAKAKLSMIEADHVLISKQMGDHGTLILATSSPGLRNYPLCVARAANLKWLEHPARVEDGFYSKMKKESEASWRRVRECGDPDELLRLLEGVLEQTRTWKEQTQLMSAAVQAAPAAPKPDPATTPLVSAFSAVTSAVVETRVGLNLFDFRRDVDAAAVASYAQKLQSVASDVIGKRLRLECIIAIRDLAEASALSPEFADAILHNFEKALRAAFLPPQALA
jgi:hypothetical protein